MAVPAVIFTRKPGLNGASQILFCISQNQLPMFNLVKISPSEFALNNKLLRQDKFDWHVNKNKPICFTFELVFNENQKLPTNLDNCEICQTLEWLNFPQASKKIGNGTHRNLLQLVVQYISYGQVDDEVIAAEYNEEWLKELQHQVKKSD